jgi:hypothetical protein
MKIFRIVKQWVKIKENECVRFKVEQRHHFMWLFHWWKVPSFAPEPFKGPSQAVECVRDKYPNAVIHDCYSEPKVGG